MLLYGKAQFASLLDLSNTLVLNFTSFNESYPRLALIPPISLGTRDSLEFDIKYMEYIMSVDHNFMQLMNIIMTLYNGNDVYLCISEDDWSETLIESLLKLIQQRYGYNATRIADFNDILTAELSDFNPSYGLINLDMDKERYSYLAEQARIRAGGQPYGIV